ncbi:MAG: peptidyl-prolyl cis-trans isomerase [Phycisphaerae bacterium]|nr:MAG: peptidyl-prolyl cis-trans isomerase [Phycisphaerae bacterium]
MNRLMSLKLVMAMVALFILPSTSMAEDAPAKPRVKLTTSLGDMVIELDAEKAPVTVKNFLAYVNDGYYDGTIFHRVIPNFMIQGGGFTKDVDKKTDGLKPPIKLESDNGLKNVKYSIAMARTGNPDSATSQFFINVVDNARLNYTAGNPGYAAFGMVVEGQDIVEKIRTTECIRHEKYPSPGAVTPKVAVVIKKASVVGPEEDKPKKEESKEEGK